MNARRNHPTTAPDQQQVPHSHSRRNQGHSVATSAANQFSHIRNNSQYQQQQQQQVKKQSTTSSTSQSCSSTSSIACAWIQAIPGFFISHNYQLFHSWNRSIVLGSFLLCAEFVMCFALQLNQDVVNALQKSDTTFLITFRNISIDALLTNSLLKSLSIFFLILNACLLLTLICLFIFYCYDKYTTTTSLSHESINSSPTTDNNNNNNHKNSLSMNFTIISVLIKLYLPIFLAPQFYVICKHQSAIDLINLPFCFVFSYISANSQTKLEFSNKDSLSKLESACEMRKFILTIIFVAMSSISNISTISSATEQPIYSSIYFAYRVAESIRSDFYIDSRAWLLELQLGMCALAWSLLILYSLFIHAASFILITALVTLVLSFKLAAIIFACKTKNQQGYFVQLSSFSQQSLQELPSIEFTSSTNNYYHNNNNTALIKQFSPLQIDQFARMIWKHFLQESRTINTNESLQSELLMKHHVKSCRLSQCYCKINSIISNKQIAQQHAFSFASKRQYATDLILSLYKQCFQVHKEFTFAHLSFLVFLQECAKNEPLLGIKLMEIRSEFSASMSFSTKSFLHHLIAQSMTRNTQKDIFAVVQFDHELDQLAFDLIDTLRAKESFLRSISEAYIELSDIEEQGKQLIAQRRATQHKIYKLLAINPKNQKLEFITLSFQQNIAFDISKLMQAMSPPVLEKLKQREHVFMKHSAVVFVSIGQSDFGRIQNISSSFSQLFEYSKRDVLNKNVSMIMPKYVGDVHDLVIQKFIHRGHFASKQFSAMQPFYMLNKAGFLIEVRMQLQLSLIENDRIGVSALMQTTEDRDSARIAIANVNAGYSFSGCSRQIYEELFSLNLSSPMQLRHYRLSSLIPIIPLLINKYGKSQYDIETKHSRTPLNNTQKGSNQNHNNLSMNQSGSNNNASAHYNNNLPQSPTSNNFLNQIEEDEDFSEFELGKAKFFQSDYIETVAFLARSPSQSANYQVIQSPSDFVNEMKRGAFAFAQNLVFLVRVKVQMVVDDHIHACQVAFEEIELIESLEAKIECIQSVLFDQVRELSNSNDPNPIPDDEIALSYFQISPLLVQSVVSKFNSQSTLAAAKSQNRLIKSLRESAQTIKQKFQTKSIQSKTSISLTTSIREIPQQQLQQQTDMLEHHLEEEEEDEDDNDEDKARRREEEEEQLQQQQQDGTPVNEQMRRDYYQVDKLGEQKEEQQSRTTGLFQKEKQKKRARIESPGRDIQQFSDMIDSPAGVADQMNEKESYPVQFKNTVTHEMSDRLISPTAPLFKQTPAFSHQVQPLQQQGQSVEQLLGLSSNNSFRDEFIFSARGAAREQSTTTAGANIIHTNVTSTTNQFKQYMEPFDDPNNSQTVDLSYAQQGHQYPTSFQLLSSMRRPLSSKQQYGSNANAAAAAASGGAFANESADNLLNFDQSNNHNSFSQRSASGYLRFFESRIQPNNQQQQSSQQLMSSSHRLSMRVQIQDHAKEQSRTSMQTSLLEHVKGNNNNKRVNSELTVNKMKAAHAETVSSQRSSNYNTQKALILNALSPNKHRALTFNAIILIAAIAVISVSAVIVTTYIILDSDFQIQKKNFYYISWAMNERISISRVNKNDLLAPLIAYPEMQIPGDLSTIKSNVQENLYRQYLFYYNSLKEISTEYLNDLQIVQTIMSSKQDVMTMLDDTKYVKFQTGLLNALSNLGITLFQITQKFTYPVNNDTVRQLNQSLYQNFMIIVSKLETVQKDQEQNIVDVYDRINQTVILLLVIICSISALFVVSSFPVYSIKQMKKQNFLKLFATIDPFRIKQMHSSILSSLVSLEKANRKAGGNSAAAAAAAGYSTSYTNIINAEEAQTEAASKRVLNAKDASSSTVSLTRGGSSITSSGFGFLLMKKKQISGTSRLPKHSHLLFTNGLFLYALLIAYPVVNYFTTNQLVSQSNNNQTLAGLLQTIKAQLSSNMATLTIMMNADMDPTGNSKFYSVLINRFKGVQKTLAGNLSKFSSTVFQQSQNDRHFADDYTSNFFNMIIGDACAVMVSNPSLISSKEISGDTCETQFNGLFKQGIQSPIDYFSSQFAQTAEIYALNDQAQRLKLLYVFLETNSYWEMNTMYESLMDIIDGLGKFLVKKNEEFFDLMTLVQTALMAFQFVMLFGIFRFGLIKFYVSISRDLAQTKEILTLLPIPSLIENQYIMNFLAR